ncbi:putative RNA-directed DNA polymerase from transposon X-element [Trichonephila clavipes]|nr:putative RNA-directed DNA polymerase from transposon X-element [Trichonephila clavipes]
MLAPSTSRAFPTPAPSKDASVNAGLLKDLLVIIEDTPCIDKQVFCRAFKNSLSALRSASANVDKTYVIFEAYCYGNFGKELGALVFFSEFRTLSREIAKDIKSYSHTQWEKHIEALSPEDNTLWRKSSLLRKPFRSIPPLKGALGSTAITPIEKAEVIADSLQEQFEPNHVAGREDFDQRIHEEVENFLATPYGQEIDPTTPTEVLTYVQRLKTRKSSGLDQISNHHSERELTGFSPPLDQSEAAFRKDV